MNSDRFSRRSMLKALGLGAGFLPLLHSERSLAATADGFPTRFIAITWGNGTVADSYFPAAGPLTGPLPAILSPLEAYKSKMLTFRAANAARSPIDLNVMVDAGQRYGGHSAYPAVLTGTWKSASASGGASIDQLIATQLTTEGVRTPLLNLGARPFSSTTSYKAGGQKNTPQVEASKVLSSLFSTAPSTPMTPATPGNPTTVPMPTGPTGVESLQARRKSVLDAVKGDLTQFGARLGQEDKLKIEGHMEAIRDLERKLAPVTGGPTAPMTPTGPGVPVGAGCAAPKVSTVSNRDNNLYPDLVGGMMALAGAAAKCDYARCITIDLIDDGGGNSLSFPFISIGSPDYHAIAHQGRTGYPNKIKIDTWYFTQVAKLVKDLADTPEGSGSVLDHTCILICNDMNEGANHDVNGIPYLIIGGCGGFFKQGQSISFPKNVPNNHLLTSVGHAMGLQIAGIGDAKFAGDIDALIKA
ncbi:MAG TPA: DUF1552 domain-containing protein [Polyangiaceae bacterium]|nr:DUF1552 domain-containing protein [Polyangiaceae bacterium]